MRALLVVLALVGTTACAASDQPPAGAPRGTPPASTQLDKNSPSEARGETAPGFTVTTFEGERFALGDLRGTPVVLNFWESW